MMSSFIWRH